MKKTTLTRSEFVRQVNASRLKLAESQGSSGYDLSVGGLSDIRKIKIAKRCARDFRFANF